MSNLALPTEEEYPMTAPSGLTKEHRPLSQLLEWRWSDNPKAHQEELIESSVRQFGFNDPPEADEEHKLIVAGHGRLEFLARIKALYDANHPDGFLPSNIFLAADGDWLVPTILLTFESREQALRYALAHNRSGVASLRSEDYDKKKMAGALARQVEAGQIGFLGVIGFGQADFAKGGFGAEFEKPFQLAAPPAWDSPEAALALAPGGVGGVPQTLGGVDAATLPPDSHVGMVQLFLTRETRALLQKRCEKLARIMQVNSLTEVVWNLVQQAHEAQFGRDTELPSGVLPGQIGFTGEVVEGILHTGKGEAWVEFPETVVGEATELSPDGEVGGGAVGGSPSASIAPSAPVISSTSPSSFELPSWDAPQASVDVKAATSGEPTWKGGLCPVCGGSGGEYKFNPSTRQVERMKCAACGGAGDKASWEKAHNPQPVAML